MEDGASFAVENGYIEHASGRRRYFTDADKLDKRDQNSVGREAKNSRLQGLVADLLAQAGINFYRLLNRPGMKKKLDMRVLLPIHDAFLFEVKEEHIEAAKKAIVFCMSTKNPIPGKTYKLGVDIEVFRRWGEKRKE